MKIIDAHSHIFPKKIAEKATEAISDFYEHIRMGHMGSPEELLKSGKEAGVTKYLVFSTATIPAQVKSINDFILDEAKNHKEFIPIGTMHRDFEDYEEEIERISGLGLKGIKLHPDFQKFNFDDEKLYPIYDLLEKKGMFVITHSGDYRHGFSNPERVAKVAKKFKNMPIIAAHCGGWSQWDIARDCLKLDNIYVDTSSTMGFSDGENVKKAIDTFGEKKIFFGSDFPMWDHKAELDRLMKLGLKEDLLEDILYNNFKNFYGLEE